MKKEEAAKAAEVLLQGRGWVPALLRTVGAVAPLNAGTDESTPEDSDTVE